MNEQELEERLDKLEKLFTNKQTIPTPKPILKSVYTSPLSGKKNNAVVDIIEEMLTLGRTVLFEPVQVNGKLDSLIVSVISGADVSQGSITIGELVMATYPGGLVAGTIRKCSSNLDNLLKEQATDVDSEF